VTSRRDFIQKLSTGIALPGLMGFAPAIHSDELRIDHSLPDSEFWKSIRAQFPLTEERIYLNNGTFGPSPYPVLKALEKSLAEVSRSGEYGSTYEERKSLAAFLGVKTSELSLTHNTTEGINIMAWGVALSPGDEVLITDQDHAGNALPWLNRARMEGIVPMIFSPATTAEENLELIKRLVTPKTKVIAIPHVTCTTGLVFPIKEISEFARSRGILTAIDGAHGAGIFDLNLDELGCDFYAGCCHKWLLGPAGTAFLYVREEMLDHLNPIHFGAGGASDWDLFIDPPLMAGYVASANRYDYGTQSTSLMMGVSAAIAFHKEIGTAKIEARVRELNQYLFDGLREFGDKIDILTPAEAQSRVSMATFRPKNLSYKAVGNELAKRRFRIRQVPEGRTNGIRISTHLYNSTEEIDQLLLALPNTLG
jgi:selenocysteine lyase/cysteine desulfurase